MKIFELPDLGEGLPDAEIIEWHVAEGDDIKLDDPLVSMETAKAVVEIPSPFSGKVTRFFGQAGDIIETGKPLAGFEVETGTAEAMGGNDNHPPPMTSLKSEQTAQKVDTGTVVGKMESSGEPLAETLMSIAGIKITPGVRAMARKLKVSLETVIPSGKGGVVTRADVENAASNPPSVPRPSEGFIDRTVSSWPTPPGSEWQPVRGTRRSMARAMSESHAQLVPTSIMDDADIQQWLAGQDLTVRLLRSIRSGVQAEPVLNAWYDAAKNMLMVHKEIHVGMAIDTPDGLFAASLRKVHSATAADLRDALNRMKFNVENRSIPPEDLKAYTIMLSNFGMLAGRYATAVITPPCVSIIAAGKARNELVAVLGRAEVHRVIPLSLTFDHRVCTGGEAARFLQAMLEDLALPE